jgi:hypothetical protein
MKNSFRLQSAMEYLMTYGWAILIIAVVLGVLFQMGIFNSSSLTVRAPGGACKVLRTSVAVNLVGQCSGILPKYVALFDGAISYVNAGNGASLQSNLQYTYSAWINPSATAAGNYYAIMVHRYSLSGAAVGLWLSGNALYLQIDNNGRTSVLTGSAFTIQNNVWQHVALTIDASGNVNLWLNGVSNLIGTVFGPFSNYDTGLFIGCHTGSTTIPCSSAQHFSGFISNIQVYNASLDSSQMQTLYLEGLGGAPVNPQYLVGWWPLNGDANDYSGNNNNGAPTAITYVSQYGK